MHRTVCMGNQANVFSSSTSMDQLLQNPLNISKNDNEKMSGGILALMFVRVSVKLRVVLAKND